IVGVEEGAGLALVVTGSVLFALGLGSVFTLVNDLIVGTAPLERAGSASAMSETGAEFGGALGIAILGSVGAAIYRTRLAEEIPRAVSSDQADAATDTLGAALEVAGGLPARVGGELADAARAAFTSGMRVTALIATAISVGVAALIFAVMRPGRLRQQEIRSEGDER
ncbi:MAG: MFS transporter, partial [Actinomycetota bacterium]